MSLIDPTSLSDWLRPHSIAWYKQLSNFHGKYKYTWNSTITDCNGELIFDKEVYQIITNKKVLDVGCGHGEYTIQCSLLAKEIVGIDVTDKFIMVGNENKNSNVSFIVGNTKKGLPFESNEFDCAYIRKGPTSAYPFLKQVVKKGGKIIGLHPGDESGKELLFLFPDLFKLSQSEPVLDVIKSRLDLSNFSYAQVEVINGIEYIHSPLDVIKLRCFGQKHSIYETLKRENLAEISRIFAENSSINGLSITFSRYIVRATV